MSGTTVDLAAIRERAAEVENWLENSGFAFGSRIAQVCGGDVPRLLDHIELLRFRLAGYEREAELMAKSAGVPSERIRVLIEELIEAREALHKVRVERDALRVGLESEPVEASRG